MKPYAIDKIVDPITDKVKLEHKPEEVGKPVTKETAAQVRQLLERVVTSPKGTGTAYKIDGYSVGGKTGTAQIPDGKRRLYDRKTELYILILRYGTNGRSTTCRVCSC